MEQAHTTTTAGQPLVEQVPDTQPHRQMHQSLMPLRISDTALVIDREKMNLVWPLFKWSLWYLLNSPVATRLTNQQRTPCIAKYVPMWENATVEDVRLVAIPRAKASVRLTLRATVIAPDRPPLQITLSTTTVAIPRRASARSRLAVVCPSAVCPSVPALQRTQTVRARTLCDGSRYDLKPSALF